jgi:(p)ppGpp synthase/HD superfamily hydrolase
MFVAMAEDLRVIFIKLSDRVHNMKTLKFHPKKEKRIRIAQETLNIYAPIADRLGLHNIKNILQEECFKILEPKEYKKIKSDLRKLSESKKIFKTTARAEIEKLLNKENIEFEMDFRVKSIYSIYKKMKRKNIEDIRDLHDVYGIRIVVDNV